MGILIGFDTLYAQDYDNTDIPLPMLEPLIAQYATFAGSNNNSLLYINKILDSYDKQSSALGTIISSPSKSNKQLRIAWISSDISYHPVARFLYGWFANTQSLQHEHILVDVNDHGIESYRIHFDQLFRQYLFATLVRALCLVEFTLLSN